MATAVVSSEEKASKQKSEDRVVALLNACRHENYVSIEQPFKSLIQMTPTDLSRLPGTPATVMLAQTLSYLKSTNKLREPILEDQTQFQRAYAILVTANKKKGT